MQNICLVSDHKYRNGFGLAFFVQISRLERGTLVLRKLVGPEFDSLKRLSVCVVVNNDGGMGAPEVPLVHSLITFITRSVPYIEL